MSFDMGPKHGGADATNRLPEGDGRDGPPWPDQTVDVLRSLLTEPAGAQLPDWYHRKYQWTAFPEAARVHDDLIVHFMSGSAFFHSEGARVHITLMPISRVQRGDVVIEGQAADNLWAGLCILAADWRELAKEVPSRSVQPE